MSNWLSTKARRVLAALKIGWLVKRQSGSQQTLSRASWEDVVFAFHDDEETGPKMLARLPEWYPWLLCGLRTGMRAGELLALQWGDFNWQRRFVQVQRNLVRGVLTTPKNHQRRRVDLSHQLPIALRLWRRQQRAAWLAVGRPFPEWVFSSVTGTALDESNVRKALNRILDSAGVHRRGPHQMRHYAAFRTMPSA